MDSTRCADQLTTSCCELAPDGTELHNASPDSARYGNPVTGPFDVPL